MPNLWNNEYCPGSNRRVSMSREDFTERRLDCPRCDRRMRADHARRSVRGSDHASGRVPLHDRSNEDFVRLVVRRLARLEAAEEVGGQEHEAAVRHELALADATGTGPALREALGIEVTP